MGLYFSHQVGHTRWTKVYESLYYPFAKISVFRKQNFKFNVNRFIIAVVTAQAWCFFKLRATLFTAAALSTHRQPTSSIQDEYSLTIANTITTKSPPSFDYVGVNPGADNFGPKGG